MLRTLALGLARGSLQGLALGVVIGVGLAYGLHWAMPAGSLLGYLAAMLTAATVGVLGGRAPWREGAWLVAVLKGLGGLGVGALLEWLATTYVAATAPSGLVEALRLGGSDTLRWVEVAPLTLGAIGAIFGVLVELDHAGESDEESDGRKPRGHASDATVAEAGRTVRARGAARDHDDDAPARTRRERKS